MHSIALVKLYEEKHKRPEYLEMADAQITSALSRGAQHPEAYVALGKARLWLNRLDGAHEAFSTSVDLDPRDAQSWIWLSRSEGALGRSSAAIAALDSALVHAPRNVSAWIERGTLWADRGQWDRAVRDFERAIGLDPIGWPHAWNGLGFVMLSRSEPSKAVPFFEQATQLDPDYTKARSNLGSTYLLLGQEDEAATQFTEVIRQDPTVPEAWANLALISFEGGRVEEARELLQRGLAANPADARMRQLLQTWQGRN
jgi:tetratricopeptide (TPR) repeat protein